MKAPITRELDLRLFGYKAIAGVAKTGGALAGPVVAAAVILPEPWDWEPEARIIDSKRPTPREREEAFKAITAYARARAVGLAEVDEIEGFGIDGATLLAMARAVDGLDYGPDHVLVDGLSWLGTGLRFATQLPVTSLEDGERESISIAAASIIAKVARDRLMDDLDRKYPGYGLAKHKGYPTAEHRRRLQELGPSPIHRRNYRPVTEVLPRCPP